MPRSKKFWKMEGFEKSKDYSSRRSHHRQHHLRQLTVEFGDAKFKEIRTDDEKLDRKLKRKIDYRIIGYLTPLFFLFNLDRANIAYARIFGIERALDLTPEKYSLVLSIVYIGYVIFEYPSNFVVKITPPHIWLSIIILLSGILTLCMVFVMDFSSIMATRFFLGLFEAAFFPGVVYLMGLWYTRQEQGFRTAIIASASTFSSAIGGPLAYGVCRLEGVWGLSIWQWLFIVEGVPTIVLGIFSILIVPGLPQEATWLEEEEKEFLIEKLASNAIEIEEKKFDKGQFIDAIKDYKTYLYLLLFICFIIPTSSLGHLMPTIIEQLGFGREGTLLLTSPPYIVALVFKLVVSWNADRTSEWCYHLLGSVLFSIIGFVLQLSYQDSIVKYLGIIISFSGAVTCLPLTLSWSGNNMIGSTKAPTVVSLINIIGGLGGFFTNQMYMPKEAPAYVCSNLINIGSLVTAFLLSLFLRYRLKVENRKLALKSGVPLTQLQTSHSLSIASIHSLDIFHYVL